MGGGQCTDCVKKRTGLQRKLTIGASYDPLEREADRVADQVSSAPTNPVVRGTVPPIQRFSGQATGDTRTAPASVDRVLASSGRPLDPMLQRNMEHRFGYDFSQVRVHSDAAAAQSAQDVNAHAYTVGHNIVFGPGRFAPGTQEGRRLIAHELTHVVQQLGTAKKRISQNNDNGGRSSIHLDSRDSGSLSVHEPIPSMVREEFLRIQRQEADTEISPADTNLLSSEVEGDTEGEEDGLSLDQAQDKAGSCPVQRVPVGPANITNFLPVTFNVNRGCRRVRIDLTAIWNSLSCCDPGRTYSIDVTGPAQHRADLGAGIDGSDECITRRPPQRDTTTFNARPGRYTLRVNSINDPSCATLGIRRGSFVQVS